MLFTIITNVVALGAVAALVSAVVKKDRQGRPAEALSGEPVEDARQGTPGPTAGRSS